MRIAIFGATGHGGTEAMRLLQSRADVEIAWIGSDRLSGTKVADALPQFRRAAVGGMRFAPLQEAYDLPNVDVALLAMPHGEAHRYAPPLLEQGIRVIDFSGDFRLPFAVYEQWYKKTPAAPPQWSAIQLDELQKRAVYGLPELFKKEIATAQLVANPGCHATCAELSLLPLAEAGCIERSRIIVDAKSGVSGAGKNPQQSTHFVEA